MRHHHHHRGSTRIPISSGTASLVQAVVLSLVGLLLLGLGGVLVVIALNVPILRAPFLGTGGMLAPLGLLMMVGGIATWIRRASAERVKTNGIPGTAQVVGMSQTAFYVSNQPVVDLQLTITTAMHAPYTIMHRATVPGIMMPRLTSGQPLPVMVDPAQPQNVSIVWEQATTIR